MMTCDIPEGLVPAECTLKFATQGVLKNSLFIVIYFPKTINIPWFRVYIPMGSRKFSTALHQAVLFGGKLTKR